MLQPSSTFQTSLGFEVRDVEKFAQWTISDGTPVRLETLQSAAEEPEGHIIAHLVAPDGLAFTAVPVDASLTAGTPQPSTAGLTSDASLSVLALWNTPDVPGSAKTLENIGAKPDTSSNSGKWVQFRAKHGGYVAAHGGSTPSTVLSFEYDGDLVAYAAGLRNAGFETEIVDEAYGRTLLVAHPDGDQLWINERQSDLHGYTRSESSAL
ncbi:hypothetical protein [Arthrobacter sp. MYb227]|uniref:hypothetical protein n=1 Tax=Arthrobacter sp. MYb227 TaxID=1848601 RepID=UPI0011B07EB9|nr:hypothetical protein [Arthrobacter sp. MYb227]